jgi:transposase
MHKRYPSDISREQFAKILPLLEAARKKTRPRTVDLYDVFCAVLYMLRTACQWRMFPKDLPNPKTIYAYFKIWSEKPSEKIPSILEEALKKIGRRNEIERWQKLENLFLHH